METQGVPIDSVHNGHDASLETSAVVDMREVTTRSGLAPTRERELDSQARDTWGSRVAKRLRLPPLPPRWRGPGLLIAVVCAVICIGTWSTFSGAVRAPTLEQSLAGQLRLRGLSVDPAHVVWLSARPSWFGIRPALMLARHDGELRDIYYADVRTSGKLVLGVHSLTNTTRTSSADEDLLVGNGTFAAYAARVGDAYDALMVVDARGEPAELTRSWPWYAKLQNAITNYQDTGRARAFGLRRYRFSNPVGTLTLAAGEGMLRGVADGQPLSISPRRDAPVVGPELAKLERAQKGRPGTITWVVDTVRRIPSVGRAPIDWLEHTVFGVADRVSRAYHEFVKTDTAAEVKQALSVSELPHASAQTLLQSLPPLDDSEHLDSENTALQPDSHAPADWPPAPMAPLLTDKVDGEGVWLPVEHDAFAATNPNGPPLFYQSFIRVDPQRTYTRVYITMWDPRQVQLGMVMGTKEPESATGETGNGLIPRDPYVMSHLVGAFNGGFQAMHGEFGMMAGKRVYLPPKPFAATVAVFEDGSTGMGSWPGPGAHTWDESFANSQIPKDMLAMRQNLTSVVEGEAYNPWQRWWWGAAPEWAKEQTFIHRSGLCVTREGFMGYFWGESMGPEELGKTMHAARCVRGMHLDMNGKHTGFELYQPFAKDQVMPDLGRALRPSEFEGAISNDATGMHVRARLAVTTMSPLRFPRYLNQDPRDYFYLTRKPTLPGADLVQPDGSSLAFSTRGLPNAGFPFAFARTQVSDLGWVVRIDLTRAVPKSLANPELTRPLAYLTRAEPIAEMSENPTSALYAQYQYGRLRARIGQPTAASTTLYTGPLVSEFPQAHIGMGVDDEGFLVYAEATQDGALPELLRRAGVTDANAIALTAGRLVLHGDNGLRRVDGQAVPAARVETSLTVPLVSETRPAARVLFDDVTPMPYRKWGGMQDQRVRYFPSHPARFLAPDAAR